MKNRVKALRIAHGYTEKELADLLDISLRTLQRYQAGGDIPGSILVQMAGIFGVSVDALLRSEEDEHD